LKPFDDSHTRTDSDFSKVRRLAVRGAGAAMAGQASSLVVQMAATVVLARLLTPTDFGLVTMVTTFSLLVSNFGLNGFTEAVLQREQVDRALASNLFWICVGFGVLLTIGFAACGTLIARFYGVPAVAPIAVGVSLSIFFTSTYVLHAALLMRAMYFPLVSANAIVGRIVSVAVSIVLAWAGWGYWALVAGIVAEPLSVTIGAWTLCRWIPSLPGRAPGTGSMAKFAVSVYGRFSLNYFSRNVDNLLVGWRFNAQALGFYKKAYDLFALSAIVQSLTSVAVSALRRLRQDEEKYRNYLVGALSVAGFVGLGIGGDMTLVGRDVILFLLGPKWDPAGRIFMYFGPGFGVMFLYGVHGWIHLSVGRPDRWVRWGLIEFLVTGLLFVVALPWGPVGIATMWSVSLWLLTLPAIWYAGRPIKLRMAPIVGAIWKFVVAASVAAAVTALVAAALPSLAEASDAVGALTRLLKVSALFALFYAIAVVGLHRSFAPLSKIVDLLREMAPRRGSADRSAPIVDALPVAVEK
jgi:polysaccharide transporter, PST family